MAQQPRKQNQGQENIPEQGPFSAAEKFWQEFDMKHVRPQLAKGVQEIKDRFEKVGSHLDTYETAKYGEGVDKMRNDAETGLIVRQGRFREVFDKARGMYMENLGRIIGGGMNSLDEQALLKDIEKSGKEALRKLKEDQKAYLAALGEMVDSLLGPEKQISMEELITLSFVARNLGKTVSQKVDKKYHELAERIAKQKNPSTADLMEVIRVLNQAGTTSAQAFVQTQLEGASNSAVSGLFLNLMTRKQKEKMVGIWIENYQSLGGNVGAFLEAMIITGVMRNDEKAEELFQKAADAGAIPPEGLQYYKGNCRNGAYYTQHQEFAAKMAGMKKQLLEHKGFHTAGEILNLPNFLASRAGDIGMMVALANLIFSDKKTLLTNPYFLGGLAVMGLSYEKVTGDPYGESMTSGIGRGIIAKFITGPSEAETAGQKKLETAKSIEGLVLNNFYLRKYFDLKAGREAFAKLIKIKTFGGQKLSVQDLMNAATTDPERGNISQFARTCPEPDKAVNEIGVKFAELGLSTPLKIGQFLRTLKTEDASAAVASLKHTRSAAERM